MPMRALLVDDDPVLRRALARRLRSHFEIDEAEGLASALEKMAAVDYDVIITDEKMPDGTGRSLLAIVRARQPGCQRILMSGDESASRREPPRDEGPGSGVSTIVNDDGSDPAYDYFFPK